MLIPDWWLAERFHWSWNSRSLQPMCEIQETAITLKWVVMNLREKWTKIVIIILLHISMCSIFSLAWLKNIFRWPLGWHFCNFWHIFSFKKCGQILLSIVPSFACFVQTSREIILQNKTEVEKYTIVFLELSFGHWFHKKSNVSANTRNEKKKMMTKKINLDTLFF